MQRGTDHTIGETQGTHGGEVYRLARILGTTPDSILDFSSNANSLCDDLTATIVRSIDYPYRHYPDTWCETLRNAIATHEDVEPASILVGNGSSENIFLTIARLRPKHALLVAPIFSEYARACQAMGVPYTLLTCRPEHGFDLTAQDLEVLRESNADLVVLCSPNNPACITYPAVERILQSVRAATVLVDNTYSEFLWGQPEYAANRYTAYAPCIPEETQLITVQSFTKFFYCTGIRLGYSIASPTLTATLAEGKTPWTVSAFAEQAGCAFLGAIDAYRERLPAMRTERAHFMLALKECGVFEQETIFGGVNFVTARLMQPCDAERWHTALLQQGMLVRVCDNIPGMPEGFLRMQVREEAAWTRLIAALSTPLPR